MRNFKFVYKCNLNMLQCDNADLNFFVCLMRAVLSSGMYVKLCLDVMPENLNTSVAYVSRVFCVASLRSR